MYSFMQNTKGINHEKKCKVKSKRGLAKQFLL